MGHLTGWSVPQPENLLVFPGGRVQLADFGLAQSGIAAAGESTQPAGSPGYQPPELVSSRSALAGWAPYDPRKLDSWAAATTIFTLLTGFFPLGRCAPL
jgi:serine/threonine protein kinase